MSESRPISIILLWHRRVLGGIWTLAGVLLLVDLRRASWWDRGHFWLPALVGTVYAVVGVAFVLGRTWARRAMVVLIALAALAFADMVLLAGSEGDRPLLRWMLTALGFTAYTAAFLWLSAILKNHEARVEQAPKAL